MRTLIKGKIEHLVPFFNASTGGNGMLTVRKDGDFSLTVDTGFDGAIALPEEILEDMGIDLIGFTTLELATGEVKEDVPVYWGKVKIGRRKLETWFIPGDSLLGMEFFSLAGSLLSLDFEKEEVELKK